MTDVQHQLVFRASWPVIDEDMTLSQLQDEAARQIDGMVANLHAVIVGPIVWKLHGVRLLAQAPAVEAVRTQKSPDGTVAQHEQQLLAAHEAGQSYRQIADDFGFKRDSVAKAVRRARLRAAA